MRRPLAELALLSDALRQSGKRAVGPLLLSSNSSVPFIHCNFAVLIGDGILDGHKRYRE